MSVAACPPAPMAAMFSFSLGEMVRGFELAAGAALLELHVNISPEAAVVEVKMKWRREWRRDEEVMGAISRLAPRAVKGIDRAGRFGLRRQVRRDAAFVPGIAPGISIAFALAKAPSPLRAPSAP